MKLNMPFGTFPKTLTPTVSIGVCFSIRSSAVYFHSGMSRRCLKPESQIRYPIEEPSTATVKVSMSWSITSTQFPAIDLGGFNAWILPKMCFSSLHYTQVGRHTSRIQSLMSDMSGRFLNFSDPNPVDISDGIDAGRTLTQQVKRIYICTPFYYFRHIKKFVVLMENDFFPHRIWYHNFMPPSKLSRHAFILLPYPYYSL